MGVELLLDSVIIIDHLNEVASASDYLARVQGRAAVSVVTRAETLTGYPADMHDEIRSFLNHFPTLTLDTPVADLAALLRRQHRWRLPDAFQAALAQHHDLRLATRNTRDFPEDRFPFVLVPYRL